MKNILIYNGKGVFKSTGVFTSIFINMQRKVLRHSEGKELGALTPMSYARHPCPDPAGSKDFLICSV